MLQDAPEPVTEFTATVTQLAERPLRAGTRALLRYGSSTTRVLVTSIEHLLDIDTLTYSQAPKALALNDIAQVTLRTAEPLPVEAYRPGGAVGSLLIIDPADGTTLSAGMVGDRRAALHPPISAPPQHSGGIGMSQHSPTGPMALERCPRSACTGRAYPLSPDNAHTPGP